MINYTISCRNPHKHFIDITLRVETLGRDKIVFQLPAWRPGRYELANYAQNIQQWKAYNDEDTPLHFIKLTKDSWEVKCNGNAVITLKYNYYAFQLDAGASHYDDTQLYVNPVNCLMYIPERINEACSLKLNIPENYQVASGLDFNEEMMAEIADYHRLADSPFIASASLHHKTYQIGDYSFHIWMKGSVNPDWDRILDDFQRFSEVQINMFGELPVKEYHFLYQLPNVKFYHGVEHLDSTVICLGPAYRLMEKELYTEFLGISSHELFHSWNIKSIRPVELYPYDYSRENYSNLGYVAEGVTTYYGDLMLLRGQVFNWDEFSFEMCKFIQRHFHNYGRYYQTLAESSFDTWLDGYKPGVPDRKVSMYVKGMMVAFMMDIEMRRDTNNEYCLDNILVDLYFDFAKKNKGFSEQDYLSLVNASTGKSYQSFFEKYVWGLEPLEDYLEKQFAYIGCELKTRPSSEPYANSFGFKIKEDSNKCIVSQIAPGSPADVSMLSINDEIIAVNNTHVDNNNIDEIFNFYENEFIELSVFRAKTLLRFSLKGTDNHYYPDYYLCKLKDVTEEQMENFRLWSGGHKF